MRGFATSAVVPAAVGTGAPAALTLPLSTCAACTASSLAALVLVTTRIRRFFPCAARYGFGVMDGMGACDEGLPSLILQPRLLFQTSTRYSP